MRKQIDWKAMESKARGMTDAALWYALGDATATARIWDRQPDQDPDGNGAFYHDEASIYSKELQRRRRA